MYAIQVEDLVKEYKNGVQALSGLNLSVKQGELFSLLGQNGAGKSTLIRILTTYLKATSGRILMFGKDIEKEATTIRSEIACVSQQTSIDTYLSLEENMIFQSRLYKIPKSEAFDRMEKLIAAFGLEQYRKYPVSSYSGGVKRRLDIALNMMTKPKLLFLDEPTVGMDSQSRRLMWEMINKIRNDFGTTVFLTTHYMEESADSDYVVILDAGQISAEGTPLELKNKYTGDFITLYGESAALAESLDLPSEKLNGAVRIAVPNSEKATELIIKNPDIFKYYEVIKGKMDDVFMAVTGKNLSGGDVK